MKYIRKDEKIRVDKKSREEVEIDNFMKKFVKVMVTFQKFNK